jgi:hypothetical protein
VIGLLFKVCVLGLTEVLMELLIDKIDVWLGMAVLWGLITPSMRRQLILGRDYSFFQSDREGESPSPHTNF